MRDGDKKSEGGWGALFLWTTCLMFAMWAGAAAAHKDGAPEPISPGQPGGLRSPQVHRFPIADPNSASTESDDTSVTAPVSKDFFPASESEITSDPPLSRDSSALQVPTPLEKEVVSEQPMPSAPATPSPPVGISGKKGSRKQTAMSEKKPADAKTAKAKITAVRMKGENDAEEWIEIFLTGYYPPEVSVADGGPPRLICDFHDVQIDPGFPRIIETYGKLVERIRIGIHVEPSRKTRVVLDLALSADYEVEQYFFEADNLYTLKVRKKP